MPSSEVIRQAVQRYCEAVRAMDVDALGFVLILGAVAVVFAF